MKNEKLQKRIRVQIHKAQTKNLESELCGLNRKKGFSLIELLVVLAILGFFVAMMTQVFTKGDDQRRFDETRIRMQEIKKAILGSEGAYANGQRQFSGYAADMGGLPDLVDENGDLDPNGQPKGLWTRDLNADDDTADSVDIPDSVIWKHRAISQTWMGWRGLYIETPYLKTGESLSQAKLRDGWGNPFVFDNTSEQGNLTIKSYGADGLDESDDDITITIRQTEYMAPVAGRAEGATDVTLYVPVNGDERPFATEDGVDAEGYFRFEEGASGNGTYNGNISIGVRSIIISDGTNSTQRVFTIEPTGNWLGDVEIQ